METTGIIGIIKGLYRDYIGGYIGVIYRGYIGDTGRENGNH